MGFDRTECHPALEQIWGDHQDPERMYDQPMLGVHWEYLYDEMVKIAEQKGIDTTTKYHMSYTDEMREKMT
jgi:hypothetical protein